MDRDQIFISYSHHDRAWLEELVVTLAPLLRKRSISTWDDTKIRTGAKWKDEITAALDRAKIAVLLVSRRFLASDFIASAELPTLLDAADKNRLVIVWIAVGYSLYEHTQITDYQAANDPSKPLNSLSDSEVDRELVRIANILESLMSRPDLSADGRLFLSEQSLSSDHQSTLLCKIVTEEAGVAASGAQPIQEQIDEAIERVSAAAPSEVDQTVSRVVNQLLNQVPEGETREQTLTPEHLRMREELVDGRWAWRSIHALAAKAGLDESVALAILRADPQVILGRAKSGRAIAKMRSST